MNSTSSFDSYYPSVPDAYYATGQWYEASNDNIKGPIYFAIREDEQSTKTLFFNGQTQLTANDKRAFFRGDAKKGPDPHAKPSSISHYYWLQASIPTSLYPRFLNITNNSGKFFVFMKIKHIDAVWEQFKIAYREGKLGYGLQCTAGFECSNHKKKSQSILVHTEDAFDLEEVGRVAWEIYQVLEKWNWKGTLYYMTDRKLKARQANKYDKELSILYSISSKMFIYYREKEGTDSQKFSDFQKTFHMCFIENSHIRQRSLAQEDYNIEPGFPEFISSE